MMNDNISNAEKASVMMPVCLENILGSVDDSLKARYLIGLKGKIIVNDYDTIPEKDKPYFKGEMIKVIEVLE